MSPRPDVSEERKHQILDAAARIFNRKGISGARMDDIARETGLSKGTLYWYFKSKDEIVTTLIDRFFRHELKVLGNLCNTGGSAAGHLWNFTDCVIADMNDMLQFMPVTYEFYALAFRSTTIQTFFKEYLHHFLDCLVPIIQGGIDTGEFRSVDAREAAIAAGAVFEGTVLLWVYDHTAMDPESNIRAGMTLLLEGLQSKG